MTVCALINGHNDKGKRSIEVQYTATKLYYKGLVYASSLVSQLYDNINNPRIVQNLNKFYSDIAFGSVAICDDFSVQ